MTMTIVTNIIHMEKRLKISKLNHAKEIIEDRKLQILKNINGVNTELGQLASYELKDEGDHVTVSNSSRVDDIIVRQQEQELRDLNVALNKVALGRYGTCEMCGVQIGSERLAVKPHAIYCIECKEIVEKSEGKKC